MTPRVKRRLAVIGLFVLATACAGEAGVADGVTSTSTGPEATTIPPATDDSPTTETTAGDGEFDLDTLQRNLLTFSEDLAASDEAERLQALWSDIESQVMAAFTQLEETEDLDVQAIQDELAEFDAAIPQSEVELRNAWTELRSQIEDGLADLRSGQ